MTKWHTCLSGIPFILKNIIPEANKFFWKARQLALLPRPITLIRSGCYGHFEEGQSDQWPREGSMRHSVVHLPVACVLAPLTPQAAHYSLRARGVHRERRTRKNKLSRRESFFKGNRSRISHFKAIPCKWSLKHVTRWIDNSKSKMNKAFCMMAHQSRLTLLLVDIDKCWMFGPT